VEKRWEAGSLAKSGVTGKTRKVRDYGHCICTKVFCWHVKRSRSSQCSTWPEQSFSCEVCNSEQPSRDFFCDLARYSTVYTTLEIASKMGAGGQPIGRGYWKNAMANTPKEALNWRLAFSVLCFGMMVREGSVSSTRGTEADVQSLGCGSWT
jgi:hypothetical protein